MMAKALRILWFSLAALALVNAAPPVTDTQSLVVSSTETPKEATTIDSNKGDEAPSIPKIYDMRVESNVTNRFATTCVTSKVKNLGKSAQEATFSVVLPETAYISGFVMEIDGKPYKAYVKEKEEAKQIYDQAISSGQAAGHVAVSARDSNRFVVSVNVEPQSKAVFKLTYEELLQRQKGQYEVVINIHPGQPVKDMNVEVNIDETRPLKFVKAPSLRSGNEISKNDDKLDPQAEIINHNTTSATVKFSPNEEKQKQFATSLGTKEENGLAGQFVVQYDVERDPQGGEVLVKDGYFVHFFAPTDLPSLPKHVVFVLDTSGSMSGTRIIQLKEAMRSILDQLHPDDLVNIVEFSSTVRVWNIEGVKITYEVGYDPWAAYEATPQPQKEQVLPPPIKVNEKNLENAKKVIEILTPYGGTDIQAGLKVGLELVKKNKEQRKDDKHQPLIVFLTDGEPTVGEINPTSITKNISDINNADLKTPIFSLSFGDGADRDFLQKISLNNFAFARHIYEAADASLQIQEFYKEISSPLLNNVKFTYVSNVTKLTKTDFPIFFHGGELVVAGETVLDSEFVPPIITGWGNTGPINLRPKVNQPLGALERLWAYLTVKQVLEDRDAAEDKKPYTKKALDLALKYSFVTDVSSLVVVKPNDTSSVNAEDASKPDYPFYEADRIVGGAQGFGGGASPVLGFPAQQFNYALAGPPGGAPISAYAPTVIPLSASGPQLGFAIPNGFANSGGFNAAPLSTTVRLPVPVYRPQFTSPVAEAAEEFQTTPLDVFTHLKEQLPWLNNLLSANRTVVLPKGEYTLGIDEIVSGQLQTCPHSPANNTEGICTFLPDCDRAFPLLTEQTFKDYACVIDDKWAGICCPQVPVALS